MSHPKTLYLIGLSNLSPKFKNHFRNANFMKKWLKMANFDASAVYVQLHKFLKTGFIDLKLVNKKS